MFVFPKFQANLVNESKAGAYPRLSLDQNGKKIHGETL